MRKVKAGHQKVDFSHKATGIFNARSLLVREHTKKMKMRKICTCSQHTPER